MKTSLKQQTVDDEWMNFMSSSNNEDEDEEHDIQLHVPNMTEVDNNTFNINELNDVPEASPIYISTKSKVAYLSHPINLDVFWQIPIIPYATPSEGVIKKQIKSNTTCVEDFNQTQQYLVNEPHYDQQIITSINNVSGRIRFKDSRKITIGMSKKDIMSYRSKKKSAFYNCFVLILRIQINGIFKEFHTKIFNTGELDIPGIQSETDFEFVLQMIIDILQPFVEDRLSYRQISDTVLINSNFNCGFFINRENLFDLLRDKYNIQSIFDPCSYPGIQSKFYYNNTTRNFELEEPPIIQTGVQSNKNVNVTSYTRVSFMIFRTGSVLIVGKCNETILMEIYEFLKNILKTEYQFIRQSKSLTDINNVKDKTIKIRKKKITVIV